MWDPDRPALCLVAPVNVVPLTVATTELLIAKVAFPLAPPSVSVRPVPAVNDLSFDRVESFPIVTKADVEGARFGADIVTAPAEPVVIVTLLPAIK